MLGRQDRHQRGAVQHAVDPTRPGLARDGVRLRIVYDVDNPANNRPKVRLQAAATSLDTFGTVLPGIIALVIGLFFTWRVYAFMRWRVPVTTAYAVDSRWRASPTA